MDKPIESTQERVKLMLVRRILSLRTGEPPDEIVRRAQAIRRDRMCRRCRWRRDGSGICVLPRCFKKKEVTR